MKTNPTLVLLLLVLASVAGYSQVEKAIRASLMKPSCGYNPKERPGYGPKRKNTQTLFNVSIVSGFSLPFCLWLWPYFPLYSQQDSILYRVEEAIRSQKSEFPVELVQTQAFQVQGIQRLEESILKNS